MAVEVGVGSSILLGRLLSYLGCDYIGYELSVVSIAMIQDAIEVNGAKQRSSIEGSVNYILGDFSLGSSDSDHITDSSVRFVFNAADITNGRQYEENLLNEMIRVVQNGGEIILKRDVSKNLDNEKRVIESVLSSDVWGDSVGLIEIKTFVIDNTVYTRYRVVKE